jgi:hypothetical protein
MKRLAILIVIAIALVGCGRESEQVDTKSLETADQSKALTMAWHKGTDESGNICDLSVATAEAVGQASGELRQALAEHGIDVVVEEGTFSSAYTEEDGCLCNRVWIEGRTLDEWLGAKVVKMSCAGCPGLASGCTRAAASGGCSGRTSLVYGGKTYEVVPANLIVMAGLVAAADLAGEPIAYSGCPGAGKGECTCGQCAGGCSAQAKTTGCPRAAQCTGKTCPASDN